MQILVAGDKRSVVLNGERVSVLHLRAGPTCQDPSREAEVTAVMIYDNLTFHSGIN